MNPFDELIDAFLSVHWTFHPVDASFAGELEHDGVLPPSDRGAPAREAAQLRELARRLETTAVPGDAGARIDAHVMRAQIAQTLDALAGRSRFHNPAWYTGEIAFGIIALLLPRAFPHDADAPSRRIAQIPDFLAGASEHLASAVVPRDWVRRARTEIGAISRLVERAAHLHGGAAALDALQRFDALIASLPDGDPAAGTARLELLMRDVHGLAETPQSLERRAAAAFVEAENALRDAAARLDPGADWREQLARLVEIGPTPDHVLGSYADWHARALHDAAPLLTSAAEYDLRFEFLPEWARDVAADLYFLFYRSPPAQHPGSGSVYWVTPLAGDDEAIRRAHNTAAVKLIHAVHHGSIGHHTQNTRARSAGSRLARIAGTDCASGIAFLAAGSMVEGWACYAEDLLAEIPGFYSPAERFQLQYFELRNIACCLADVRLHSGVWSLEEMRAFYRDEVAFTPARIWSETTRNAMFPASRLMYWTGTQQIKALRARSPLDTKTFHDRLLGYGSAAVAWLAEEIER